MIYRVIDGRMASGRIISDSPRSLIKARSKIPGGPGQARVKY